jgi:hypothetical protein
MSDTKRRRWRGGGSYNWDAEYRAQSKAAYDRLMSHEDVKAALDAMGDDEFLQTLNKMGRISRYGNTDLERVMGSLDKGDAQAVRERRVNAENAQRAKSREQHEEWTAKRIAQQTEEANHYRQNADLAAGMLQSDCHDVYGITEKHNQYYGDWMENPVALLTGGDGWGRSIKERTGIKLQITLSLDVSNSMWHNRVASNAVTTFIELGMALDALQDTYPGSVYTQQFVFAMNEDGKGARSLSRLANYRGYVEGENAGESMGKYDVVRDWVRSQPLMAGEDTWITPLFTTIESWENEESDPGCVRLDLILTDAVLEHPTDVRKAGDIQERRDGALQTILLNFLEEDEWLNGALPSHCYQYPANTGNAAGLLRKLLMEFVSVYY